MPQLSKSLALLLSGILLLFVPKSVPWLGSAAILTGAFFLFRALRYRTLTVFIANNPFTLNQTLMQQYVQTFWKERFPKKTLSLELTKNRLTVSATIPPLSEKERQNVEQELNHHLTKTIGYPHSILLKLHETTH